MKTNVALLGITLMFSWASQSRAATKVWDGSSSGNWNTAANWTNGVVPANGDDLIFPTTAIRFVITNDFPNLRLNSITFGTGIAFNYVIRGNPITLTNGIVAQQASPGANTIAINITNAASQTFNCVNAGASLTVSSNVLLVATTLTVRGSGDTTLGGVISGTGGITKLGAGTVILSGGSGNTYTGATSVEEGVLELAKLAATGFSASLTIGDGVGGINADVVRYTANDCINTSTPIIINESGLLDVNGFTDLVALLTLIGGDISTGTGTLHMGDNLTATSLSGNSAIISGNLVLAGATRTFTVTNGAQTSDLIISAAISGIGGLTKAEAGRMRLTSSNSFSGAVTVSDGVLRLEDNFAAGTVAGGVVLNGDSILELNGSITVGAEPLTNNSTGQAGAGIALSNLGGTNSWAGNIVLLINTGIGVVTNSTLELSGAISGAGALTKLQPGTLVFSGGSANTYTGTTSVEEGVLELAKASAIFSSASLTIGDGVGGINADVVRYTADNGLAATVPIIIHESGLLDLNGFSDIVGALTLIGGDIDTGSGILTMQNNLTATSLAGNSAIISGHLEFGVLDPHITVTNGVQTSDLIIAAAISGMFGMTKNEAGTMRLAGSDSFSGAVTVNDGALRLENNFAVGTTAGGVTVNGDSVLELINGTHVGNEPLTLNNNSSGATSALNVSAANSNSWAGSIVLQQNAEVNVVTGSTLNLLGVISGAGGLTKVDAGTLVFSGAGNNTYNGNTIVNEGVLELAKANAILNTDSLTIGDGVGGVDADIVRYLVNSGINSPVPIIITESGLLDLNGFTGAVGPLSLIGGDIDTGSGTLTMNNNLTATSVSGNGSIISGNLALGASTRTFTITDGAFGADLLVSAVVSGTSGITKGGDGTMFLTSSNSFSGALTVGDGVVTLDDSFAAGTTAGGVSVTGGASLQLINGAHVRVEALTLNSSGALQGGSGSNSWAGTITLGANSIISVQSAQTLNLLGAITGAGGLTKINPGTLYFSGSSANTYTNTTMVNAGTLVLQKTPFDGAIAGPLVIGDGTGGANADVVRLLGQNQISNLRRLTINSSGLLDHNGFIERVGSLEGPGNATLGAGTLVVGDDNTSTTFAGVISGTGPFTKLGAGALTFLGGNSYSGVTTVNFGTLLVNGLQPQSPVTVEANGILGGSGTVGIINNISGGVVAPGASPGILTCSNMTFSGASSDFTVELSGPSSGTGYDQLNVRGTVNLGGSTLNVSVGGGFVPAAGQAFTILNNDLSEGITGTFAGLAEGASVPAGAFQFTISYVGGSGNDVALIAIGAPLLSIARTTTNTVAVSWPSPSTGFTLQQNTNSVASVNWSNAPGTIQDNGTTKTLIVNPPTGNRFYRLLGP